MPPPSAEGGHLHIAVVCPYSLSRPGGVQAQVRGLAGAYRRQGHDVSLFAPLDHRHHGDDGFGDVDVAEGVELVRTGASVAVPANGSVAPVTLSPGAVRRGLRDLRSGAFDVVHVHEPFAPGLTTGLLLSRAIPPLVGTFHRSGTGFLYGALRPATRRLGHRLAVRCAVSPAARTTAARAVDGDIEILFNGVEIDRYRQAAPWPTDRPAVLFVGRHEERKGLSVLLEAFDQLRSRSSTVTPELWVAGSGPATGSLRARWPPDADIHWLGTISEEEKARRLVAATVLCAPSLGQESFGVVLLEAMAARTMVVASDLPGYREAAGDHAVFVAPGRPAEIAVALEGVLGNQLGAADASADGRQRWLDEAYSRAEGFSMNGLAQRYVDIFDRLLHESVP